MIFTTLLIFIIPLVLLSFITNKPIKRKPKYNSGKVYSVVLLDKNGEKLKAYTYVK